MNGKRQRDNDLVVSAALSARGECWPPSRIDSLEQLLDRIREHALSKNHLDGNPLEIIVELLSTNQEALVAEFFPSWPCMAPQCAADDFQSCPHVSRSSSGSSGGELSFSVQDRSLWPSRVRRDELSPPPSKFGGIWEYPSGTAEDYRRGLDERIGFPCISDFKEGMRIEHCIKAGCDYHFVPRNYVTKWCGTETTPKDEWSVVVDGVRPPECQMSAGRRAISIDELKQLPLCKKANLREEEIIGIALYTGPMYEIYNCILNQNPLSDHWPTFQHNHFPTTLCVIVSAVQKLGSVTLVNLGEKLYRGSGGWQTLPPRFSDPDEMNVCGMTAYGFQSFSTSEDMAINYAKSDENAPLPMVFVVEPSADPLTGFADVAEFSQYPKEGERLLPPCSFLHPDRCKKTYVKETSSRGSVEFVPMRATASKSPSLEDLEQKQKKMHIAEFEKRVSELREQLEKTARKHRAEDRLQRPSEQSQKEFWNGVEYNVPMLIHAIVKKVEDVLQRHRELDVMKFNIMKRYAHIVQESLVSVRLASSLLKLWLLDDTQHIHNVVEYTLLPSHRWFVAFLKRQYKANPGNQKNARRLCKELALLHHVPDADERIYGETPLMVAAANGRDEMLEYLVSVGETPHATNSIKQNGECALHLAADNGHEHCIRSLVRLGAVIDQPYSSNGRTALHRACLQGHSHCVDALATLKADVNKTTFANEKCQGKTPIAEAAERGFVSCIEELARHRADLDKSDVSKYTPLYIACHFGRASCVAALLRLGAKFNLGPVGFDSPLRIACKFGYHECVQEFRVVDVGLFDTPVNPLIVAISKGHVSSAGIVQAQNYNRCIQALLDLQPPVASLASALFAAIWFHNSDFMRALVVSSIARGLHLLQVVDDDGLSAEQFAVACGCDDRALVLLRSMGGYAAHATAAHVAIQDRSHWQNVMAPPEALCVTFCDTLRFYSHATAFSPFGCRRGVCAYYEVTIRHPGLVPQFGLCSEHFAARFRQHPDEIVLKRVLSYCAKGVGDIVDSWAVDGVRGKKLNGDRPETWSVRWRQGDVIGIACDMCTRQMIVSLNGDYSHPNGVVFDLPQTAFVMYPALFTSVEGHLRANLGHSPFKYAAPSQEYVAFASLAPCGQTAL